MNNIRQYLDEFFSEFCNWEEDGSNLPKGFISYAATTLAEKKITDIDPIKIERLKLLYQIYKDAGDDSVDRITTKLDTANSILRRRNITKEVHLGVSHALADMLDLGGVKELLEKIAGEKGD